MTPIFNTTDPAIDPAESCTTTWGNVRKIIITLIRIIDLEAVYFIITLNCNSNKVFAATPVKVLRKSSSTEASPQSYCNSRVLSNVTFPH